MKATLVKVTENSPFARFDYVTEDGLERYKTMFNEKATFEIFPKDTVEIDYTSRDRKEIYTKYGREEVGVRW